VVTVVVFVGKGCRGESRRNVSCNGKVNYSH